MEAKKRGTLRGPQARRSPDAHVTMRGWLDKQGSERLRLWKTRWFVLAEYCLYYYKDAREDKLLGSITLPSYRVCPVSSEDRVHRKFSFRIEHANMRTYYFACETKEKMTEWMNAISLASIMQKDPGCQRRQRSERASVGSVDGSETGFSRRQELDSSRESAGGRDPRQPLYANAPPKPRRLTGSREASSSPEPCPDQLGEMAAGAQVPSRRPPAERRTPDAYAAASPYARADYEDVYNASVGSGSSRCRSRAGEVRAHARESYASSTGRSTHMSGGLCTPPAATSRGHGQPGAYLEPGYRQYGGRGSAAPPRPHSADFLEWERHGDRPAGSRRPPPTAARPKSSLARYQPAANDYWSEEGYANKMRQAAYSGGVILPGAAGPGPPPGSPRDGATLTGHGPPATPETPPGTHSLGRDLERCPPRSSSGFMRSASARFTRQKGRELDMMNTSLPDDPNDGREGTRKKIQQREESMKRLLEWKQRMLQSPLTRKSPKLTDASVRFPPDQYKRRVRQELERSEGNRTPRPQTVLGAPEADGGDGRNTEFLPPSPAQDYVNLTYRMGDADPWSGRHESPSPAAQAPAMTSQPREEWPDTTSRTPSAREAWTPANIASPAHEQWPASGVTSLSGESWRSASMTSQEPDTWPVSMTSPPEARRGVVAHKPDNRTTAGGNDGHSHHPRIKTDADFRNFDKSAGTLVTDGYQQAHSQHSSQKDKYHHELHNYDRFYPPKEKVSAQRRGVGGELPPLINTRELEAAAVTDLRRPEDVSLGKHSDSGYDTLRAELTGDETAAARTQNGRSSTGRRPAQLDSGRSTTAIGGWPAAGWHDDGDRIDESRLVKEFSYEYVRPEQPGVAKVPPKVMPKRSSATPKEGNTAGSPSQLSESPPKNLVQERIKAFRSRLDESGGSGAGGSGEEEKLERPLRPVKTQAEVAEAQVSQLKVPPVDFKETEATTVTASEAQVTAIRSLNPSSKARNPARSPGTREDRAQEELHPTQDRSLLYSESSPVNSLDLRDIRSPQDIIDSRKSRSNLRKFALDEDSPIESEARPVNSAHDSSPTTQRHDELQSHNEPHNTSVEDLLAKFESGRMKHDCTPVRSSTSHDLRQTGSDPDAEDKPEAGLTTTSSLGMATVLGDLRRSADRSAAAEPLSDALAVMSSDSPRSTSGFGEGQWNTPAPQAFPWTPTGSRIAQTPQWDSPGSSLSSEARRDVHTASPAAVSAGPACVDVPDLGTTRFGPGDGDSAAAPSLAVSQSSRQSEEPRPPPAVPPKPTRPSQPAAPSSPIYANQLPSSGLTLNTSSEDQYLVMSPPKKASESAAEQASPAVHSRQTSAASLPPPPAAPPPPPPLPARGTQQDGTYMEMNPNVLNLSFEASQSMFKKLSNHGLLSEANKFSEVHYEYMAPAGGGGEPVYMEVPSENGDSGGPVSPTAPPIRTTASASVPATPSPSKTPTNENKIDNKRKAEGGKKLKGEKRKSEKKASSADSSASDADDEGSKEPERPRSRRFSLSDTFRPASYYLQMHDEREHPDSSDSDLVSPPPIPMSPPPMDELQPTEPTGAQFSYEPAEPETPPYLLNALLAAHSAQMTSVGGQQVVTEAVREERERPASLSSQTSSQGSLARLAADIVSRRSHDSGSLDSVTGKPDGAPVAESNRNDKYKRRPVVDEMALMTVGDDPHVLRSEDHYPGGAAQIESQPRSLLSEEQYPVQGSGGYMTMAAPLSLKSPPPAVPAKPAVAPHQTYENLPTPRTRKPSEVSIHTLMSAASSEGGHFPGTKRESFSSLTSIELTPVKSPEFQSDFARTFREEVAAADRPPERPPERPPAPPPPGVGITPTPEPAIAPTPPRETGARPRQPRTQLSPREPPVSAVAPLVADHRRGSSNISVNSATSTGSDGRAPYYYSDLAAAAALQERPARARPKLNNQRELDASKRADIGRKVNQIKSSPEDRLATVGRIAAQLRNSVEYLEAQKWSDLDERNVYDSDTLKKARRRSHTPDSTDQSVRNIFPDGLRLKSDDSSGPLLSHHRRTRSLEGLLEETPRTRPSLPRDIGRDCSGSAGLRRSRTPDFLSSGSATEFARDTRPRSHTPDVLTSRHFEPAMASGSEEQRATVPRIEPAPYRPEDRPPMPLPRSEITRSAGEPPPYRAPPPAASPVALPTMVSGTDVYRGGFTVGSSGGWESERLRPGSTHHAGLRHAQSMESLAEPPTEGARVVRAALYVNEPMRQRFQNQQRTGCLSNDDVRYDRLVQRSETLERAKDGRTYLEQYVWDEHEELFRPSDDTSHPTASQPFLGDGLPPSFEIDREELRQWDLMSSAPLVDQRRRGRPKSAPDLSRPVARCEPAVRGRSPAPPVPSVTCLSSAHVPESPTPPRKSPAPSFKPPVDDRSSQYPTAGSSAVTAFATTDGATTGPEQLELSQDFTSETTAPSVRIELVPPGHRLAQQNGALPTSYPPHHHQQQPGVHRPKLSPPPPPAAAGTGGPSVQQGRPPVNGWAPERGPPSAQGALTLPRSPDSGGGPQRPPPDAAATLPSQYRSRGPAHDGCRPSLPVPPAPQQQQQQPQPTPAESRGAPESGFISELKAGDLLGRSNEELVLLLIQLRRQSIAVAAAQDRTRQQLNSATSAPLPPEGPQREVTLQHINRLRSQIRELDKQHELTRPLVSLVDNMLKLSSLYETPADGRSVQERRRFSQRVEERRMLREEQRHWHAVGGQTFDMQARVDRLFSLDRQLTRQTADIQRLRADKHRLEQRLEMTRLEAGRAPLKDSERLLLQQRALQHELGQVRAALTSSAKSLEDTAAENSRLEREMMLLRQRLQTAMTESAGPETLRSREVRALEGELQRVQGLIDNLGAKRQELSRQVSALTQPAAPASRRRHNRGSWIETDLDPLVTSAGARPVTFDKDQPLFVNTHYDHQPVVRNHEAPPPPAPAPSGHQTLPARPFRAASDRRRHASGPAPRHSSPPGLPADDAAAGDKVSLDSGLNSSSPTDNSHQSLVAPDGTGGADTLPRSRPTSQLGLRHHNSTEHSGWGGSGEYTGREDGPYGDQGRPHSDHSAQGRRKSGAPAQAAEYPDTPIQTSEYQTSHGHITESRSGVAPGGEHHAAQVRKNDYASHEQWLDPQQQTRQETGEHRSARWQSNEYQHERQSQVPEQREEHGRPAQYNIGQYRSPGGAPAGVQTHLGGWHSSPSDTAWSRPAKGQERSENKADRPPPPAWYETEAGRPPPPPPPLSSQPRQPLVVRSPSRHGGGERPAPEERSRAAATHQTGPRAAGAQHQQIGYTQDPGQQNTGRRDQQRAFRSYDQRRGEQRDPVGPEPTREPPPAGYRGGEQLQRRPRAAVADEQRCRSAEEQQQQVVRQSGNEYSHHKLSHQPQHLQQHRPQQPEHQGRSPGFRRPGDLCGGRSQLHPNPRCGAGQSQGGLAGVHQPGTAAPCPGPARHDYMNVAPLAEGSSQARVGPPAAGQLPPPSAPTQSTAGHGRDASRDEPQELSEADERMQRFYGIIPKERSLEIKTVRIVKRESQLRQKDKTRRGMDETELTSVGEAENQESDGESPEEIIERDSVLSQFRRALSLPRGYDRRTKAAPDAISRIPNFRHHMLKRMVDRSSSQDRLSAHQRLFGSSPAVSAQSAAAAPHGPSQEGPASPVFKSDTARRIVRELQDPEQYRRAQPRPKRRHFTIGSSRPVSHEAAPPTHKLLSRSADDMDMGRALGDPSSTPDVVKSSLTRIDPRFDADTIDTLLGTPQKIHIPERYVPELEVEPPSAEERLQRSRKAASIRRMLTQSTGFLDSIGTAAEHHGPSAQDSAVTDKLQRAHILQLNEILARQVTEKSKRVAVSTSLC